MNETMILATDNDGKRFVFPLSQIFMGAEKDGEQIFIERAYFSPLGHKFSRDKVLITANHVAVVLFLQGKDIDPKIVTSFKD